MKKLLYLITILVLLCSSCKTKKVLQEYSMQSDTTRTESRTTKEIAMEKKCSSNLISITDSMNSTMIEEEFSIKFDSMGRPTDFHGKKKNGYSFQNLKKILHGTK